jgi:hypothetical protein
MQETEKSPILNKKRKSYKILQENVNIIKGD